jgi:hypothetical protein
VATALFKDLHKLVSSKQQQESTSKNSIQFYTGKKIPLDPDTNEPHDCPVLRDQPQQQQGQQTQMRYHQCNKGCGNEIYFDANNKSQSGKFIPLDKQTGLPHQCQ